jgi:hypothetical protein
VQTRFVMILYHTARSLKRPELPSLIDWGRRSLRSFEPFYVFKFLCGFLSLHTFVTLISLPHDVDNCSFLLSSALFLSVKSLCFN